MKKADIIDAIGWGRPAFANAPDDIEAGYGARAIWLGDWIDNVRDRAACEGDNEGRRRTLIDLLNERATDFAGFTNKLLLKGADPTSDIIVTLYEDDDIRMDATPNSSRAYLFIAAWLKNGEKAA